MGLAGRDYRRILDLTIDVLDSNAGPGAWQLVVGHVVAALSGEVGWMYENVSFTRNTGHPCAWSPEAVGRVPLESLLREHMPAHPLARHLATTGDPTPVTVHDVVTDLAWRDNPARSALKARFGVTRQMVLAVPGHLTGSGIPQAWRSCLISRSGTDFTASNREFARQLQPVLIRLDRHLTELHQLRNLAAAGASSPEQKAAEFGLTPRELSVLALLAQGMTSAALARRLGMSAGTAIKHIEHIYRKFGTCDRLTTVLLARELGLVPQSQPSPHEPERA